MSWDGYYTLDGNEFVNVERTEAYAADQGWFKPLFKNSDLHLMLGDAAYVSPLADDAPWVDPDVPESYDFFGYYPLDVTGVDDSSRASTVVQSTLEGGVPGRIRHATKSVVFNGLLLGRTDKATAYGQRWLSRVLLGDVCNNPEFNNGLGTHLSFLSSKPNLADTASPVTEFNEESRTLRRFVVNSGPLVTAKRSIDSCGGEIWVVTFSGVAGDPYMYGNPRGVLQGWLDPDVTDPWVAAATEGTVVSTPVAFDEFACGDDTWEPYYDPLCPALVVPPAPPSVPLGCLEIPETWDRRVLTLPGENVPLWGAVAPMISLHATEEMRNIRIRFYDNSTGDLDIVASPCEYRTDIVVSYIPADATLLIDSAGREVWIETVIGQRRRADSLVFNTEGRPVEWPSLTCGHEQIVTVDTEVAAVPPVIDLSLVPRVV